MLGATHPITFKIVGAFDLFPTWYPESGPLVIGNLEFIFEQVGGEFPYEVWLRTSKDIEFEQMFEQLANLSLRVSSAKLAPELIGQAKAKPERQGLFGLLSVGFSALAILTTLGFLLYAFFSFRQRFIELGILRVIGLSSRQMILLVGIELAFLQGFSLVVGTTLGITVSNFYIPTLQVGTEQTARIPPFVIEIDWGSVLGIYALFILLFAIAIIVLTVLLLRMKIFQ